MIKKIPRSVGRLKRHYKLRNKISGTESTPRLVVFRSNKHMYAQIIDDTQGITLVAASTMEKNISGNLKKTYDVEAAKTVGEVLGKKAIDRGISKVVFDRAGYIYHGKVEALANGAREAGLKF